MAGVYPDFEEPYKQRIAFNYSYSLPEHEPPLNVVIEIRVSNPDNLSQVASVCWTVMPLYNPAQEPNYGRWRLPVYLPPTKLDLDLKQIPALPHFSDLQLMLRIGSAQDQA
jgi:hypothetical protein